GGKRQRLEGNSKERRLLLGSGLGSSRRRARHRDDGRDWQLARVRFDQSWRWAADLDKRHVVGFETVVGGLRSPGRRLWLGPSPRGRPGPFGGDGRHSVPCPAPPP